MKIYKYDSGGMIYTPWFRDSVLNQQSQQQNVPPKEEDSLIDKEMISLLKANGLSNDVDYFLNQANTLFNPSSSGLGLINQNKRSSVNSLIQLHWLANRVTRNKEQYDLSINQVSKEGAGSEVALTNTGKIYVQTDKGISKISASQYHENPEKYQILTNSELIWLRENNSKLAFDDEILQDLSTTIGMKSIVDYVRSTINSFGTTSTSIPQNRYYAHNQGTIEKGMQELLGGTAPEGLYNIASNSSISNQGYNAFDSEYGSKELHAAVNYLYNTLPANMRHVLRANAAAEGLNPNDANDVQKLLIMAVQEHTNHSYIQKTDIGYTAPKKSSGSGSEGGSEKDVKQTYGDMVLQNQGTYRSNGFVLPGGNIEFNLPTYTVGLRTINNEAAPNVLTAEQFDMILRDHGIKDGANKVFLGGTPIDNMSVDGKNIIVDNSSDMKIIYAPMDTRGNLNMQMLNIMNEIQKAIVEDHINDPATKKRIWEDNGFIYDPNTDLGTAPGMKLRRFAVQTAYTTSKAFNKDQFINDPFVNEIDRDVVNDLISSYNLNAKSSGKKDTAADIGYGWFTNMWNDSYQTLLFVPLTDNQILARQAGDQAYMKKATSEVIKANQDFAKQHGAYDSNTGTYDRVVRGMTENGITAGSLD